MILLDKPYISDFLLKTIEKNNYPVVELQSVAKFSEKYTLNIVTKEDAIERVLSDSKTLIYTNSENTFDWIEQHLPFSSLAEKIKFYNNKITFRDLVKNDYPDYYYKRTTINELDKLDVSKLPIPVVIKPSVGFFSLGVHKVNNIKQWDSVKSTIKSEIEKLPKDIVGVNELIIEEYIEGDEFAVDCYYNDDGKPIILNIFKHLFNSENDVSDRVYITSKEIIEIYKSQIEHFLVRIGYHTNLRNFPCHVELRIDDEGEINPIEVNPLRFGGLCTTADLTWHAYGFNSYEYYFNQQQPQWPELLKGKDSLIYSLVILDNSTGIQPDKIRAFNYEEILSKFEKNLELRKLNHLEFPLFGYLFCETNKKNIKELEDILSSDLSEFVIQ